MGESFRVYIDESGDEGFRFRSASPTGTGSSEWFVLSAVITRVEYDLDTVKLVDAVRTVLGKQPRYHLHFTELRHTHRVVYCEHISKARLRAVSILIHKPSLRDPETFQQKHRLYFYAGRYLLERVSWYCRDHHRPDRNKGDGSAEIIFSNRSSMSYDDFRDYLDRLKADPAGTIHWPAIRRDQIRTLPARGRMGLMVADAVASGFYHAVEPDRFNVTEDRYAAILKPIVYHRGGRFSGYGVKLWPGEVANQVGTRRELDWVQRLYKP